MNKLFFKFGPAMALWLAVIMPTPALAYIGPGLGAGAIAVVFGVIGSIFLAIFAVLYYPIKRALKKRKKATEPVLDAAE